MNGMNDGINSRLTCCSRVPSMDFKLIILKNNKKPRLAEIAGCLIQQKI
jgi:hypothetical protein